MVSNLPYSGPCPYAFPKPSSMTFQTTCNRYCWSAIYPLCQIPITYYSLARTNINGSKQKYGTTMLSFLINYPWIPSTLVSVVFFYGGTLFHQQFPPLIALPTNEEIPLSYSWRCSQSGPHRAAVHPPNKEVIRGVYSFGNITHICLHIQSLGASEIHMTAFFLLGG